LYEDLHPGRASDFEFYTGFVKRSGLGVLDMACGSGELGRRLADCGAHVTGLDLSESMLRLARKTFPEGEWLCGDMRSFCLDRKFDLVICALNSLQHMESVSCLKKAVGRALEHLAPQGVFAFDIFNPSPIFLGEPRTNVFMRSFHHHASGKELALYEDTRYERKRGLLHIVWRVVDVANGQLFNECSYTMRQIFPEEIDRCLRDAGFSEIRKYGDFDRSPFTSAHVKQVFEARVD
jgi:SAM-dependent methyltransferase